MCHRDMADLLAADGYAEAGYTVVGIDDCWLAKDRDTEGKLQADSLRFPSGMKALARHIHARYVTPYTLFNLFGNSKCKHLVVVLIYCEHQSVVI